MITCNAIIRWKNTGFAKDPNNPDPNAYSINSQNLFVVTAPVKQRDNPSTTPLTTQEINNPEGRHIVGIINSNERWNKYRLLRTGIVIKVKMVISDAFRIPDRYDKDCMPQYVFTSSPMILPENQQTPNSGVWLGLDTLH